MRVVFDTNIVASAAFWKGNPRRCLELWARGRLDCVASPQVLSEYFETCAELAARYPGKQRAEWPEALTGACILVFPVERARGATPDRDDEMFLECALAGGADYLVTGDKRHLLKLREWQGISIVSAAEFLNRLEHPAG